MTNLTTNKRLSIHELEVAFQATVAAYGASVARGIANGRVDHEDGLPWCEVYGGTIRLATAMAFAQDLANALRARVLFHSASKDSVTCVMDFDEKHPSPDGSLPSFAHDPRKEEFFCEYGDPVLPA
jgi:hypothetical protein